MRFFSWSVGEQNILSVFWRTYMSASTCSRDARRCIKEKWRQFKSHVTSRELFRKVIWISATKLFLAINHFCVLLKSPNEHLHHPVATTVSSTFRYELTCPLVIFKWIHHNDAHCLFCQPLTYALEKHRRQKSVSSSCSLHKVRNLSGKVLFRFRTSETAEETSAMKSLSSSAYLRMVWSKTKTAGRNPSLPAE